MKKGLKTDKGMKADWFFWQEAYDIMKEYGDGGDEDLALGNKISAALKQAHDGIISVADMERLSGISVDIAITDEEITMLLDASEGAANDAEEAAARYDRARRVHNKFLELQ